jgi:peptidoglycan hydrolase-like protein with peptidoglycan-binding domain
VEAEKLEGVVPAERWDRLSSQSTLMAQGFYERRIDGIVGRAMRAGLRRFQTSRNLPLTGTITSETLDALRISSE